MVVIVDILGTFESPTINEKVKAYLKEASAFICFVSGVYNGGMHRDKVILYGLTKDFKKYIQTNKKRKNSHVVELSQKIQLYRKGGVIFFFFVNPFNRKISLVILLQVNVGHTILMMLYSSENLVLDQLIIP